MLSKTKLLAWVRKEQFRYDDDEEFLDTDLSRALDRDSTYYGGGMQVELTPLTTFLTDVEVGEDRFVGSPERDADTWKVMPGFRFKPFALDRRPVGRRLPEVQHPQPGGAGLRRHDCPGGPGLYAAGYPVHRPATTAT